MSADTSKQAPSTAAPAGIVAVGWVRAGEMAIHAAIIIFVVTRVVSIPRRDVGSALWPAVAAAAGVAVGAGSIRLFLPELTIAPLVLGSVCGLLGGIVALRVLSPKAFGELMGHLAALRPRLGARGGPPSRSGAAPGIQGAFLPSPSARVSPNFGATGHPPRGIPLAAETYR